MGTGIKNFGEKQPGSITALKWNMVNVPMLLSYLQRE